MIFFKQLFFHRICKLFIPFFLFLYFVLFSNLVFAFDIPESNGFVTDNADIFTQVEERELEDKIVQIEDEFTVEIAVLTVDTTGDVDIYDFTLETFREWGIGKMDVNNGIFIVIAVEDRQWRIMTGYGVEGVFPDSLTKKIAEKNFPDNFRSESYFEGVLFAINDIESLLENDPYIISDYEKFEIKDGRIEGTMAGHIIWISFIFLMFFRFSFLLITYFVKGAKDLLSNKFLTAGGASFFMGLFTFWMEYAHFQNGIYLAVFLGIVQFVFAYVLALASYSGSSGGASNSSGGSSGSGFGGNGSSGSGSSGGGFGGGSTGGGGSGGTW